MHGDASGTASSFFLVFIVMPITVFGSLQDITNRVSFSVDGVRDFLWLVLVLSRSLSLLFVLWSTGLGLSVVFGSFAGGDHGFLQLWLCVSYKGARHVFGTRNVGALPVPGSALGTTVWYNFRRSVFFACQARFLWFSYVFVTSSMWWEKGV